MQPGRKERAAGGGSALGSDLEFPARDHLGASALDGSATLPTACLYPGGWCDTVVTGRSRSRIAALGEVVGFFGVNLRGATLRRAEQVIVSLGRSRWRVLTQYEGERQLNVTSGSESRVAATLLDMHECSRLQITQEVERPLRRS
jgi:hypothetical protein